MKKHSDWNEVYKESGQLQYKKDELVERVIEKFKENKIKRILDLGCGTGRHTRRFAEEGFDVIGLDISEVALNISEHQRGGLNIMYTTGSMTNIFYPFRFFNGVFCFQVIHHARLFEIRRAISEIKRVLRSEGLLFITFPTLNNRKIYESRMEIEPNTFLGLDSIDGDVPHHFFAEDEIKSLLIDFNIIGFKAADILVEHENISWNYFIVLARKK